MRAHKKGIDVKKITIVPSSDAINLHLLQRSLWEQVKTELGDAKEFTTNVALASMLADMYEYRMNAKTNAFDPNTMKVYPVGTIEEISVNVDPNMKFDDNRIFAEGIEITVDVNSIDII